MKLVKDYPPETQWQTRNGLAVRILCTDAPSDHPVIGYMTEREGGITTASWRADGTFGYGEGGRDLIPVPVKRSGWVNVYQSGHGPWYAHLVVYPDRDSADRLAVQGRTACKPFEWTEGEGIE